MKFTAVRHSSVGAGKEKRVEKSLEISARLIKELKGLCQGIRITSLGYVEQVFQATFDDGEYKVVIQGLRDVAGNYGPGGEDDVIDDWIINLR